MGLFSLFSGLHHLGSSLWSGWGGSSGGYGGGSYGSWGGSSGGYGGGDYGGWGGWSGWGGSSGGYGGGSYGSWGGSSGGYGGGYQYDNDRSFLANTWELVSEPFVTAADAIDAAYTELADGAGATIDDLTDITSYITKPIPLVNVVAHYLGEEIDFQSENALELSTEYVNFKDDTINVLQALGVGILDFDKALTSASLTQEGILIDDTLVASFDAVLDVFEGIFTAA